MVPDGCCHCATPADSSAEKPAADRTQVGRRSVLQGGLTTAVAVASAALARPGLADEASKPPQIGDHLVFFSGEHDGKPVKPEDLPLGGPQSQAWPADPTTGALRNAPMNLLVVARFDPTELSAGTRARSAEGVVAYSAICTHQGCPVTMWNSHVGKGVLFCACHSSEYDPRDGAKVVGGPAPDPLAGIPVKVDNGLVVIAGAFTRPVGPEMLNQ